jgi:hypothetical protein
MKMQKMCALGGFDAAPSRFPAGPFSRHQLPVSDASILHHFCFLFSEFCLLF